MFDWGFYVFLYLVIGACRLAKVYSVRPTDGPAWPYPPYLWKIALIVMLWPLEVLANFWANGMYSKRAFLNELKIEIKFLIAMILALPVVIGAYYAADSMVETVWLKILIACPLALLIQKLLAIFLPSRPSA